MMEQKSILCKVQVDGAAIKDVEFEYTVNSYQKTWEGAEESCVEEGGHLASYHSRAQLALLQPLLEEETNYWVGAHDREWTDRTSWIDDSAPKFFNFESIRVSDCGQLRSTTMRLSNQKCTNLRSYICKRKVEGKRFTPVSRRWIAKIAPEMIIHGHYTLKEDNNR